MKKGKEGITTNWLYDKTGRLDCCKGTAATYFTQLWATSLNNQQDIPTLRPKTELFAHAQKNIVLFLNYKYFVNSISGVFLGLFADYKALFGEKIRAERAYIIQNRQLCRG
jgi:hypothetical protein